MYNYTCLLSYFLLKCSSIDAARQVEAARCCRQYVSTSLERTNTSRASASYSVSQITITDFYGNSTVNVPTHSTMSGLRRSLSLELLERTRVILIPLDKQKHTRSVTVPMIEFTSLLLHNPLIMALYNGAQYQFDNFDIGTVLRNLKAESNYCF